VSYPPLPARLAGLIARRIVRFVAVAIGVLAALVVAALVVAFAVSSPSDRWTVAGGVAGIGALAFAFIATFVAVIAYRDSTQKPQLWFWELTCSDARPMADHINFHWIANMTLANTGPVAARFMAVRVTLDGAEFSDVPPGWPIDPSDKHIVQLDSETPIIHPGWKQNVRALNMWVTAAEPNAGSFTAKFEVVADSRRHDRKNAYGRLRTGLAGEPPHQRVALSNVGTGYGQAAGDELLRGTRISLDPHSLGRRERAHPLRPVTRGPAHDCSR
jgi:hypothetical protein